MTHTVDIVCLSHLRWDFVVQRPQHLMRHWAREHRVFYIEEAEITPFPAGIDVCEREPGIMIAKPHLPDGLSQAEFDATFARLIDTVMVEHGIRAYILWLYTPMTIASIRHLDPLATIYDCMDDLAGFRSAPRTMREREAELLECADIVFTGGYSLFEAKRKRHSHVYPFPSSVDVDHFMRARLPQSDPFDQKSISHPRLGYVGVIDERVDLGLLADIADARHNWQLVLIGPVAKIDASALPRRANIHLLGKKDYEELPTYLAGWDVALLPFAHNDATRVISPTKTPEYLAAGKPVVSTAIADVVRPYGEQELVRIADTVPAFITAVESTLVEDRELRLAHVDRFLRGMSWERTWREMAFLIEERLHHADGPRLPDSSVEVPVPHGRATP